MSHGHLLAWPWFSVQASRSLVLAAKAAKESVAVEGGPGARPAPLSFSPARIGAGGHAGLHRNPVIALYDGHARIAGAEYAGAEYAAPGESARSRARGPTI